MSDTFSTSILLKPFALGLYIGLLISLIIFIREKIVQKRLKREIKNLKSHIQTKLEIESESNERKKREIEELKKQNENLRISLQKFMEKPGRRELKQLNLYQKAVEILTVKAPGFAQSWQSALEEAEKEMGMVEKGVIPFVKRIFIKRPGISKDSSNSKNLPDRSKK